MPAHSSEGERAELAPCQHISQSLLNGEQSLQTLPSTQGDAETQGDLGEREVRVSASKLHFQPAPRSLRW